MGNAQKIQSIALLSGKGGVGRSYYAVGLARAFARTGKTLLIDLDSTVHTCDILLGLEDRALFTLNDLAAGADPARVFLKAETAERLYLCPAPDSEYYAQAKKTAEAIFDTAREMEFDTIIFDAPRCGAGAEFALRHANEALIVSSFDAVSVLGAEIAAYEAAKRQKEPKLLLNRFAPGEKCDFTAKEIIDRTHARLVGVQFEYGRKRGNGEAQIEERIFANIASRLRGEERPLFDGIAGEKKLRRLAAEQK